MKLPHWECNRCGYKWVPRSEKKPLNCANPKCRSPYWDKQRTREIKKHEEISTNSELRQSVPG